MTMTRTSSTQLPVHPFFASLRAQRDARFDAVQAKADAAILRLTDQMAKFDALGARLGALCDRLDTLGARLGATG